VGRRITIYLTCGTLLIISTQLFKAGALNATTQALCCTVLGPPGSWSGDQSAAAAFASAIFTLRELSTPYHLAGGLLDHAEYLTRHGDTAAAALATAEAQDIAHHLGCQPLLDRVADMTPAESRMRT